MPQTAHAATLEEVPLSGTAAHPSGHATGRSSDDRALLQSASSGDPAAWQQLVARYDRLVCSVARSFRLQSADVADVSQLTWLRLVEKLHTIRDPDRLPGWLAVTASRESLRVARQADRLAYAHPLTDRPDPSIGPEASAIDRDTAETLWAAVAELPPRQRVVLMTLFKDDFDTYHEVATNCGMPLGSVGPTRARALSRLRRDLEEHGLG
jgi:RNA polymerase sigma factor (sigma-70 family)